MPSGPSTTLVTSNPAHSPKEALQAGRLSGRPAHTAILHGHVGTAIKPEQLTAK